MGLRPCSPCTVSTRRVLLVNQTGVRRVAPTFVPFGRLVTKHELLEGVWPGVFVDQGILTVHVAALRKALGDTRRSPAYIKTVSRSGYRCIGLVVLAATGDADLNES